MREPSVRWRASERPTGREEPARDAASEESREAGEA